MRKAILGLVLALGLAGCQTTGIGNLFTLGVVGTPITADQLYAVENGAIIAFAGLKAYRSACVAKAINQTCRGAIAQVQVYTRRLPGALVQLRAAVKAGDNVNAVTAYNLATQLLTNAKATAVANGVAMGAQ